MGFFRKSTTSGRKPRVLRQFESSGLGAERLEGRALLSAVSHLNPAEIATIRAEREAAHHDHEIAHHDHEIAHPTAGDHIHHIK